MAITQGSQVASNLPGLPLRGVRQGLVLSPTHVLYPRGTREGAGGGVVRAGTEQDRDGNDPVIRPS